MRTIEITFTEEQRDDIVKNILADSIMWERLNGTMNRITGLYDPSKEDWEPGLLFMGIHNAFHLMGFPTPETLEEEEEINPTTYELFDIFSRAVKEDSSRNQKHQIKADVLAEQILVEWKGFLTDLEVAANLKKAGAVKYATN